MERPDVISGKTIKKKTECGSVFLTINFHENKLIECEIRIGKTGTCQNALLTHLAETYSLMLQNTNLHVAKKVLKNGVGVTCSTPFFEGGEKSQSCIDWICKTLLSEIEEQEKSQPSEKGDNN